MDNGLHHLSQWRMISALTLLVLLLAWESLIPFFTYFAGNTNERIRHGLKNLALGVFNSLLTGLGFAALWWATARWAQTHRFGVLNWVPMPVWARLAGTFLLFDAWMYWWHRMNHRIPFLWRFHRTHHSDPRMDVTTASRFHIGETALSSVLRVPVIALFGVRLWELALYELAMFTVVQVHHANIALPGRFDHTLRALIVTPFMHKLHHSRWQPETDSNYSSLFSFWDRLFHTFRTRNDEQALRLGLDAFDSPRDQTLVGLLAMPIKRVKRVGNEAQFNQQPLGGRAL